MLERMHLPRPARHHLRCLIAWFVLFSPHPAVAASPPLPSAACAAPDRLAKGDYSQRSRLPHETGPPFAWEFNQPLQPPEGHLTMARTFNVYVPSQHASRDPLPLVIDFHSSLSGAWVHDRAASRMRAKGEHAGFIVVQPDSFPAWTVTLEAAEQRKLSDIDFVRGLLQKLDKLVCFDRNRIFATGWSTGGAMATTTACASASGLLGDFKIAAIAPVGGFGGDGCPALKSNPVPMRFIISNNDRTGYLTGAYREDETRASASVALRRVAKTWAEHNGCTGEPTVAMTGQTGWGVLVDTITYVCANVDNKRGTTVLDLFDTGPPERNGHIWPGGAQGGAYPATDVVWDFLKTHPR